MNGISSDVLSILFFAAIVLGQLFLQQYRKRQAARQPPPVAAPDDEANMEYADDEEDESEDAGEDERAAAAGTRAPALQPALPARQAHAYQPLRDAQDHGAPRTIRRHSRRALLGSPQRVQDAVVVATILGRCRAFEPHDSER